MDSLENLEYPPLPLPLLGSNRTWAKFQGGLSAGAPTSKVLTDDILAALASAGPPESLRAPIFYPPTFLLNPWLILAPAGYDLQPSIFWKRASLH